MVEVKEANYIWISIMKAVTFYFSNLEPTQSLHRFVLPFLTFMVDLTFGKILNVLEDSQQVNYLIAIAHVQKVSFLQMRR